MLLLLLLAGAPEVDRARLVSFVEALQAIESRVAGTAGAARAGDRIAAELQSLGLVVERKRFAVMNPYAGRTVEAENLRASLGPDGRRLVLVAHLDARGAKDPEDAQRSGWRWDRSPAPGADDNASGCALLLELAHLLRDVPLDHGIDLVFTGAEEMAEIAPDGFMKNLGAEVAAADYQDLLGAIAVDMVLRARPFGPSFRVYSDGRLTSAALAEALLLSAWALAPAVELQLVTAPGFTYSDHGSFWARGFGAVLIIGDDFHHARYHQPSDRFAAGDPFYDVKQLEAATTIVFGAALLLAGTAGARALSLPP